MAGGSPVIERGLNWVIFKIPSCSLIVSTELLLCPVNSEFEATYVNLYHSAWHVLGQEGFSSSACGGRSGQGDGTEGR